MPRTKTTAEFNVKQWSGYDKKVKKLIYKNKVPKIEKENEKLKKENENLKKRNEKLKKLYNENIKSYKAMLKENKRLTIAYDKCLTRLDKIRPKKKRDTRISKEDIDLVNKFLKMQNKLPKI